MGCLCQVFEMPYYIAQITATTQEKLFTFLKDSFNDPMMKAKLKFWEFICDKLNKFL